MTEIIVYLGTPSLVFTSLVGKPLFGGFAVANLVVCLIGAQGVNRQLLLLYGALPAAVINFILTEKYRQEPGLAASIVVISTAISSLLIPSVL